MSVHSLVDYVRVPVEQVYFPPLGANGPRRFLQRGTTRLG
jgi:hypothetical protein